MTRANFAESVTKVSKVTTFTTVRPVIGVTPMTKVTPVTAVTPVTMADEIFKLIEENSVEKLNAILKDKLTKEGPTFSWR